MSSLNDTGDSNRSWFSHVLKKISIAMEPHMKKNIQILWVKTRDLMK
ncbi:hypothetical protein HanIR_Chr11g0543971 [Helianthus annuus]|nr:hypothetical protein HanIR_Chr11g0543971 [Helianthus annuus]